MTSASINARGTHPAMESVLSQLRKKVVGPYDGSCACRRSHLTKGRIDEVLPPADPRDYGWWAMWKVWFVPDDDTLPPSIKPLSGYMRKSEIKEVLKVFR